MRKKAIVRTLKDIFILVSIIFCFALIVVFVSFVLYKYFELIAYLFGYPLESMETGIIGMVTLFILGCIIKFIIWRYNENIYDLKVEEKNDEELLDKGEN